MDEALGTENEDAALGAGINEEYDAPGGRRQRGGKCNGTSVNEEEDVLQGRATRRTRRWGPVRRMMRWGPALTRITTLRAAGR